MSTRLLGPSFVISILLANVVAFAQGTPLRVGPLNVTIPPGWVSQTNVNPIRIFSPDSNLLHHFTAEFFAPVAMQQDVRELHSTVWSKMVSVINPAAPPQSGELGPFIWTRADVAHKKQTETYILYSVKSGGYYIAIGVDANRADLLFRNLPAFEAMLKSATLDNVAPGAPGTPPAQLGNAPAAPSSGFNNTPAVTAALPATAGTVGPASLGEYVYAVPQGWTPKQYSDGIVLSAGFSNENCMLSMWPMRAAGGNLFGDAENAFRQIFSTYELRNRSNDGMQVPQTVIRGTSGQGWDYVILKQGIGKPPASQWETLMGFVMVAKLDNRLAVVSGLSKLPLVSNCFGELINNVWPDFFYSLRFRSWASRDQSSILSQRIAGTWTTATATASDQFTFNGNGRFAGAAAAQQYHVLNNSEMLTTTQGYFGDGAYTLQENTITLKHDNRAPETARIRLEQESTNGGRNWTDVLYLLRVSNVDGKEYEVRYQKK